MADHNDVPANRLLQVLSDEIAEMCRMSEKVQTIVVIACANLPEAISLHRDAQICDLLTQKLSTSAGFLSAIAKRVPDDWTVSVNEATRGMALSELAQAYSLERPAVRTESNGAVEFFEESLSSQ